MTMHYPYVLCQECHKNHTTSYKRLKLHCERTAHEKKLRCRKSVKSVLQSFAAQKDAFIKKKHMSGNL